MRRDRDTEHRVSRSHQQRTVEKAFTRFICVDERLRCKTVWKKVHFVLKNTLSLELTLNSLLASPAVGAPRPKSGMDVKIDAHFFSREFRMDVSILT
jgi:hypothetical protein